MPKAARSGDNHTCPKPKHVGGPILPPCSPTVTVDGRPAARVGDKASCNGPPDTIAEGSPTVFIDHMQAARLGDRTAHGGVIVTGSATVTIGDHPT